MLTLSVEQMYQQWLGGLSLRKIGHINGLGRMTVLAAFRKVYGKDACNLRKQSLARIVFQEYGDMELADRARNIDGLFRSTKTDNNYSKMQTTDLDNYHLTSPVLINSQPKFNLRLYKFVTRCTTHMLYLTLWNRVNRNFLGSH